MCRDYICLVIVLTVYSINTLNGENSFKELFDLIETFLLVFNVMQLSGEKD